MKIVNRKKFMVRILELIVIIATIVLTILSIKYANQIRGYRGFGGEYLVPILGFIVVMVIEDTYQESEKNKKKGKRK